MERRALCTLALGDPPYFALTHPLLARHAERIGAEFVRIEGPYEGRHSNLRKLEIGALLDRFDRVLFIDGDVAVRADAPDLFDVVPEDRFGAYREGDPWFPARDEILKEACEYYGAPVPSPLPPGLLNTGVFVASQAHRELFAPAPAHARKFRHNFMDMPLFNARIVQHGYAIEPLDMRCNYLGALARQWNRPFNAYDAYFFHATGGLGRDRMRYLRRVIGIWESGLPLRNRAALAFEFACRAGAIRARRWRPFRKTRRRLRAHLRGAAPTGEGGAAPRESVP